MLIAGALASSGDRGEAMTNLSETAREAERLGADSVRQRASRQLRVLSDHRGGWKN